MLLNILKNNYFPFLLGLLVFSSFCQYIMMEIFHFPFNTIEFFFIPIFIKHYSQLKTKSSYAYIVVIIIFLLTLLGQTNNKFQLNEILAITRCASLFGFTYIIARYSRLSFTVDNLYYFSLGCIVGDILNSILRIKMMLFVENASAVDINIIFSMLWVALSVYKGKKFLVLSLIIMPIAAFFSISRGISIFFIITSLLSVVAKTSNDLKKKIGYFILLIIMSYFCYSMYYSSEKYIESMSPSIHTRLYNKVGEIGSNEADNNRYAAYYYIANHIDEYIFPRGLLGKQTVTKSYSYWGAEEYAWDSAYSELFYTFGIIGFAFLFFQYSKRLYLHYTKHKHNNKNLFSYLSMIMMLVVFFEMFFGYGILRTPVNVSSLGLLMGYTYSDGKRLLLKK